MRKQQLDVGRLREVKAEAADEGLSSRVERGSVNTIPEQEVITSSLFHPPCSDVGHRYLKSPAGLKQLSHRRQAANTCDQFVN
jgi:hypothetical protein